MKEIFSIIFVKCLNCSQCQCLELLVMERTHEYRTCAGNYYKFCRRGFNLQEEEINPQEEEINPTEEKVNLQDEKMNLQEEK